VFSGDEFGVSLFRHVIFQRAVVSRYDHSQEQSDHGKEADVDKYEGMGSVTLSLKDRKLSKEWLGFAAAVAWLHFVSAG